MHWSSYNSIIELRRKVTSGAASKPCRSLLFAAYMKNIAVIFHISIVLLLLRIVPARSIAEMVSRLLPAKAMNVFEGFSVYNTYNLFGNIISLPAAIVIISISISTLALPLAYSRFKRYQVA